VLNDTNKQADGHEITTKTSTDTSRQPYVAEQTAAFTVLLAFETGLLKITFIKLSSSVNLLL